nr:MAG TPA: hypothetical protein [Caudoviricetes sp.]
MTLNELIDRLAQLRNDGYDNLIVASEDEDGLKRIDSAEVELSVDGVGKYICLRGINGK